MDNTSIRLPDPTAFLEGELERLSKHARLDARDEDRLETLAAISNLFFALQRDHMRTFYEAMMQEIEDIYARAGEAENDSEETDSS